MNWLPLEIGSSSRKTNAMWWKRLLIFQSTEVWRGIVGWPDRLWNTSQHRKNCLTFSCNLGQQYCWWTLMISFCMPRWPAVVKLCNGVRTLRAEERRKICCKNGRLPTRALNFRYKTLSLIYNLDNWLCSCQPKRGSPCNSLFWKTCPSRSFFRTCCRASSASCAFNKTLLSVSDSKVLSSALTAVSMKTVIWTQEVRTVSWISCCPLLHSSLSRPDPMHGRLIRGTFFYSAWAANVSKEASEVPKMGWLKNFCLVMRWKRNHFESGHHCGQTGINVWSRFVGYAHG